MKETSCVMVCTTLPTTVDATEFARVLVERRLAACVQILKPVWSVYRWKEDIECEMEQPLQMKTTTNRIDELVDQIRGLHPYEVPEGLIFDADGGSRDYQEWVQKETAAVKNPVSDKAEDKKNSDEEKKK